MGTPSRRLSDGAINSNEPGRVEPVAPQSAATPVLSAEPPASERIQVTPDRAPGGRWAGLTEAQTLAGLLLAGLFVCGAMAVWQDDSFWHLRCGQAICQLRTVPRCDIFSYALPAGTHWPNHEWLAQVLLYGLYCLGGLPLASLAVGAVLAAAGAMLIAAMAGSMERRFAILLTALPWVVAALSVRPQVLTLAAMAATLLLLVRRTYWALPLVFLAWANVHGGVVLGGLLMCGWCAGTVLFDRGMVTARAEIAPAGIASRTSSPARAGILSRTPSRGNPFPRPVLAILLTTALCGAATLLTPMGWHIITFPIESVRRLKQLQLTEWMPPRFSAWQDWYFWLLLAAAAVIVLARLRRLHTPLQRKLVLVMALFSLMASMSARNIPNFLVVAVVALSHVLWSPRSNQKPQGHEQGHRGELIRFPNETRAR